VGAGLATGCAHPPCPAETRRAERGRKQLRGDEARVGVGIIASDGAHPPSRRDRTADNRMRQLTKG
jgi:hypothetical protein